MTWFRCFIWEGRFRQGYRMQTSLRFLCRHNGSQTYRWAFTHAWPWPFHHVGSRLWIDLWDQCRGLDAYLSLAWVGVLLSEMIVRDRLKLVDGSRDYSLWGLLRTCTWFGLFGLTSCPYWECPFRPCLTVSARASDSISKHSTNIRLAEEYSLWVAYSDSRSNSRIYSSIASNEASIVSQAYKMTSSCFWSDWCV